LEIGEAWDKVWSNVENLKATNPELYERVMHYLHVEPEPEEFTKTFSTFKGTDEWISTFKDEDPYLIFRYLRGMARNYGFLTFLLIRAPNSSDLSKRIIDKIDLYHAKDLRGESL